MKFVPDIHVARRMNPSDFGDFSCCTTMRFLWFGVKCLNSCWIVDSHEIEYKHSCPPQDYKRIDPLTFHLASSSGHTEPLEWVQTFSFPIYINVQFTSVKKQVNHFSLLEIVPYTCIVFVLRDLNS